eukprot:ANDGO_06572.mRNA.1 hypothetical protein
MEESELGIDDSVLQMEDDPVKDGLAKGRGRDDGRHGHHHHAVADEEEDEDDPLLELRYRKLVRSFATYVVAPFFVGSSLAFGMACGYAVFDRLASVFKK